MNYIPRSNYFEVVKSAHPVEHVRVFDPRGIEAVLKNAAKVLLTRYEVRKELVEDVREMGEVVRTRIIPIHVPNTRSTATNMPIGLRRQVMLGHFVVAFLNSPLNGVRVLDHIVGFLDDVCGNGPLSKVFAYSMRSQEVELRTRAVLRAELHDGADFYSFDSEEERQQYLTELEQMVEEATEKRLTYSIEKTGSTLRIEQLDLEAYFNKFMEAVGLMTSTLNQHYDSDLDYWRAMKGGFGEAVAQFMDLVSVLRIEKMVEHYGAYVFAVLQRWLEIYGRFLGYGDGIFYREIGAEYLDLWDVLGDNEKMFSAFRGYVASKRAVRMYNEEAEVYKFKFDSLVVDNGVCNLTMDFFDHINRHAVNLAMQATTEDVVFDMRNEEFIQQAAEFIKLNVFVRKCGDTHVAPQQLEILVDERDNLGLQKGESFEYNPADYALAYDRFIKYFELNIREFSEFVDKAFEHYTTFPLPSTGVRSVFKDNNKYLYSFNFFVGKQVSYVPYVLRKLVSTPNELNGKARVQKDARIANNTTLNLPQVQAFSREDPYMISLEKEFCSDKFWGRVELPSGYRELWERSFMTLRVEQRSATKFFGYFECDAVAMIPPTDVPVSAIVLAGPTERSNFSTVFDLHPVENLGTGMANVMDLWFAFRSHELDDSSKHMQMYESRLKAFGKAGFSYKDVTYLGVSRWNLHTKGRETLLHVIGGNDLARPAEAITRVKTHDLGVDKMKWKDLRISVPRYHTVVVPVPVTVFNHEYIQRVKEGGVIYAHNGKDRNGAPFVCIKKEKFTKLPLFSDCYTMELSIDISRDARVSGVKSSDVARDTVMYTLNSALSVFGSVDTEQGERIGISLLHEGKGVSVDNWSVFFSHACSKFADLHPAIGYCFNNLYRLVNYGVISLAEYKTQIKQLRDFLRSEWPVQSTVLPCSYFCATASEETFDAVLEYLSDAGDVGDVRAKYSELFGEYAASHRQMPDIFTTDVRVMLSDVKFQRKKLLGTRPNVVIDHGKVPETIVDDPDQVIPELVELFTKLHFIDFFKAWV